MLAIVPPGGPFGKREGVFPSCPPRFRMERVSAPVPPSPAQPLGLSPAALGTACCIVSAVCYTAANICMRQLSVLEADTVWVMCCKEAVAPLLVGPVLVVMALCGRPVLPPLQVLAPERVRLPGVPLVSLRVTLPAVDPINAVAQVTF